MKLRSLTTLAAVVAALTITAQARADVISFYLTQPECTGTCGPGTAPALISDSVAVEVTVDELTTTTATVVFSNYNSSNIGDPVELNVAGTFEASTTLAGGFNGGNPCYVGGGAPACAVGSEDDFGTMDLITSAVGANTITIGLTATGTTTWADAAAVLTPTTTFAAAYSQGFEAVVAKGSNGVQDAGIAPAPPIGHGLPGILAVVGVLFGAGLIKRGKKHGFFGVAHAG